MNHDYLVGIYLRLSKEDEKNGESGSITNQRAILLHYIKEHNLTYVNEYVDDGVSGTTFNRIGFNQMIKDIEEKKINMVITKDTSRLGRDHIEFGYYVEKYFPEKNIRYVAVCDNIDTFYNNNDMLLFKSAYNDMYVKDISNKIRASLNIKKRNGEFVGAYAPYGYQKDIYDKHKLVIDEEASSVVKKIFELFIQKNSISKIAILLTEEHIPIPSIYKNMNRGLKSSVFGIWTSRTITDILKNPTYMGDLTQGRNKKINYKSKKRIHTNIENWIVVKNGCPAIVERSTFELAQEIFKINKHHQRKGNEHSLLFKNFIYCKECNHRISFRNCARKDKNGMMVNHYYGNCNYYLKKRSYQVCTPHSVRYEEIEEALFKQINALLLGVDSKKVFEYIRKNDLTLNHQDMIQKKKAKIIKEIELEHYKLNRLYEDKLSGFISQDRYLEIEGNINQKITNKNNELKSINQKEEQLNKNNLTNYFESTFTKYLQDKTFLATIIHKITISEDGKIDIYFNLKNVSLESISCNPISQ